MTTDLPDLPPILGVGARRKDLRGRKKKEKRRASTRQKGKICGNRNWKGGPKRKRGRRKTRTPRVELELQG